jgi:alpha-tubulin suppressor-like RCC1 family protein
MTQRITALAAAIVSIAGCGSNGSTSSPGTPGGPSSSSSSGGSGGLDSGSDPGGDVTSRTSAVSLSIGMNSACALTTGGAVKCWGTNGLAGALGNNSQDGSPVPLQVPGLTSGVAAVSVGYDSACAITAGGGLACWGALASSPVPVPVPGLTSGVRDVSVGHGNTACAVTGGGSVMCWDFNVNATNEGTLGNGSLDGGISMVPVQVTGLTSGAIAVSVGWSTACAITQGGGLECWGSGYDGQLGTDAATATCQGTPCSATPLPVTGLTSGVVAVSVGQDVACAITTGGAVKCWGDIGFGLLAPGAPGESSAVPLEVPGLTSGVTAVSVSSSNACALTAGGGVMCWGVHDLGIDSVRGSATPVQSTGLTSGVTSLSVGPSVACVVVAGGGVECWGSIRDDELLTDPSGNPLTSSELVAIPQPGF